MFTHDPFQAYQTALLGGSANPYGLPYPGIHPLALTTQPFLNPGIGGIAHNPQGLGYGQQLPYQQVPYPQMAYLQALNPWHQIQALNPLAVPQQSPFQHQQLGHPLLQNPLLNPMLAYQTWAQQTPFQYPLPAQTFLGQGGIGQPFAQHNPLAQIGLRQPGLSPFC